MTASAESTNTLAPSPATTKAAMSMGWPAAAIAVTLLVTVFLVFNADAPDTVASVDGNQAALSTTRDVRFEDQADGSIRVTDALKGNEIERIAPATNGFLRGAVRGLVRERKRQGIDAATPFTIATVTSGRLVLFDRATGREIDLASFGATNAGVFASLLMVTPVPSTKAQL